LWVPFLAFAALVWWMYRTLAHVPGGQPIGALERGAAMIGRMLRAWLKLGRGRPQEASA
jgi:lipopolysaccharide export system permease protein